MSLIKQLTESAAKSKDISRLAKYWSEHKKDRSADEVAGAIADELEQLEYSPEDVESVLPQILKAIK